MASQTNYERYPNNVFKPINLQIDNEVYNYFLVRFNSVNDVYRYLTSNPIVNTKIFPRLCSKTNSVNNSGMPYEEALEDLKKIEDPSYLDFVKLIKDLVNIKQTSSEHYETVYTVAGGHLNIPRYSAGIPLCYETEELVEENKFIEIFSALSFPNKTSAEQIFNRATIIISIINALEKRGYNIKLRAFEMSYVDNEIVNIEVGLKSNNKRIDLQSLYKTSYKKEFLKRILFAVLETVDVKNNSWDRSYGYTCREDLARKVLNVNKKAIFFGTPKDLGIQGYSIQEDFESCLRRIKLEENFDGEIKLADIGTDFQEQIKRLRK